MSACEGCDARDNALKGKDAALQAMQQANDELARENAGLDGIVRRAGRTEQALRVELTRSREEEAGSEDVRELLELWRDECKFGSTQVEIGLGTQRAGRVKTAIKQARKSGGMDKLRDAIRGATLDDWAMGRAESSPGTFNDIAKHLLKDEETIERFAKKWRDRQEANARTDGPPVPYPEAHRMLTVRPPRALPSEKVLAGYVEALQAAQNVLARLKVSKGWEPATLLKLGVGWHEGQKRLVFPVRNETGVLVNAVYYASKAKPKSLAVTGRSRGLFPAPETLEGEVAYLTEGEPDAITAHGLGLPACGVPGTSGWKAEWVPRFEGRKVVVVFDCDTVGREAAHRVADSLALVAASVRVLDLEPGNSEGLDLTDAVMEGLGMSLLREMVKAAPSVHRLRSEAA